MKHIKITFSLLFLLFVLSSSTSAFGEIFKEQKNKTNKDTYTVALIDKNDSSKEDKDFDGILDRDDKCPNTPEDHDGWQDKDGCPDLDNDGDRIPDSIDKCPNEPEDYDNDKDEDGCTDERKSIVVTDTKIELQEKIYFHTGKAEIKEESFGILKEISKTLLLNPEMVLRIECHTDSRGSAKYNKKISEERAKAVRDFLVEQKVKSDRLIPVGYGEERPIESHTTEEGRFANRRVEFHIISQ